MAIIGPLPNIIADGQVADATPLMADFNWIVNQVNANAVPTGTTLSGGFIQLQVFTATGTFTPNVKTTKVRIRGCGGGGAGGGTPATSGSQTSVGSAGAAGAWAEVWWIGSVTTSAVTIGAGGAGATGASGGAGGTSVFGSVLTLPGGAGGVVGIAVSSFPGISASGVGGSPAPSSAGVTNVFLQSGQGTALAWVLGANTALQGPGGSTPYGTGGVGTSGIGNDNTRGPGQGFGSGGAGVTSNNFSSGIAGYNGAGGFFIVEEYA